MGKGSQLRQAVDSIEKQIEACVHKQVTMQGFAIHDDNVDMDKTGFAMSQLRTTAMSGLSVVL